jgi:hypothetical protein
MKRLWIFTIRSIPLFAVCGIWLLSQHQCIAAGELTKTGARQAGMAGASVMLKDYWGINNNPAVIAYLQGAQYGIFHENRYLMKELNFQHLGTVQATKLGTFGGDLSYFGFHLYNEKKIGLAYALKLHKSVSAAIKLNYFQIKIANDYGHKGNVYGEIGIYANPFSNFQIGIHLINPNNQKITKSPDEDIPSVFRMGIAYIMGANLLMAVEIEKSSYLPLSYSTGFEYILVRDFHLRFGIGTKPNLYAFGLGCTTNRITIDLAFSHHQLLGYSPHISITYCINRTI